MREERRGRESRGGEQRREAACPLRGVEHRRKGREAVPGPGAEQRGRDRVAQESREARRVQVAARTRDREREAGAGERACGVAGEVGQARNAPRFEELRGLDRERERGADQGGGGHRERGAQARGDQPGEAGAERDVQEHVRGDVAARRAGPRQGAKSRQLFGALEREAERIERAEDDQETDDGEQ